MLPIYNASITQWQTWSLLVLESIRRTGLLNKNGFTTYITTELPSVKSKNWFKKNYNWYICIFKIKSTISRHLRRWYWSKRDPIILTRRRLDKHFASSCFYSRSNVVHYSLQVLPYKNCDHEHDDDCFYEKNVNAKCTWTHSWQQNCWNVTFECHRLHFSLPTS